MAHRRLHRQSLRTQTARKNSRIAIITVANNREPNGEEATMSYVFINTKTIAVRIVQCDSPYSQIGIFIVHH